MVTKQEMNCTEKVGKAPAIHRRRPSETSRVGLFIYLSPGSVRCIHPPYGEGFCRVRERAGLKKRGRVPHLFYILCSVASLHSRCGDSSSV